MWFLLSVTSNSNRKDFLNFGFDVMFAIEFISKYGQHLTASKEEIAEVSASVLASLLPL